MERDIIKIAHAQWKMTKNLRALRCREAGLSEEADKLSACSMFAGSENTEALAAMLSSPQGVEFAINSGFPTIEILRSFIPCGAQQFGVYVDAGSVEIRDSEMSIVVAGDTEATIHCTHTRPYQVTVLRGAKAQVSASGWAVVRVEHDRESSVETNATDNAIILC